MSAQPDRRDKSLDRILVVKLADMGDAILATSAIGALRRAHPRARIDVLTAGAGAAIFHLCDAVDQVFTLDKQAFDRPTGLLNPRAGASLMALMKRLRSRRYDAIALLHHLTTPFGARKFRWLCAAIGAPVRAGLDNGRGAFMTHRVTDYGFGARSVHDYGLAVVATLDADIHDAKPLISIPTDASRQVDQLLSSAGVEADFVAIHPSVGGYATARNWFPDRFASVAQSIRQNIGLSIVLVGADDASPAAEQIAQDSLSINLVGRTSIAQLAALMQRARLVIGADSGVAHLAAALDVPTIAIFGPSNQAAWSPFGAVSLEEFRRDPTASRAVLVRSGIPCSPCFYTGFTLGRRDGCALRTCLTDVTADLVAQVATELLTRNRDHESAR